ncbi:MAG: hypothetical protein OXR62_09380 [Ahrensia sp.]|nr:hypothetical protein [Ahrensia sp.]
MLAHRLEANETAHDLPRDQSGADSPAPGWTSGHAVLDAHLPQGALSQAALHEIEPLRATDMPCLTGFAFALLSRLFTMAPIVWCVTSRQVGDYGHLYAYGLQRYGLSPSQIIFAKVDHPLHLHFALEEALKSDGVAAVMGEGPLPDFTGSRRLSLLAKTHNRPCLLLNPQVGDGKGSAAQTRWQVQPLPGVTDPLDPFGPGLPTWSVALARSRGGRQTSQPRRIVWNEQTLSFCEASTFSNTAVPENAGQSGSYTTALVGRTG